jgi:hypothetical protein
VALGFVAAKGYAEILAPFLSGPEIDGQVLDTLIKMKVFGYTAEIEKLLYSHKAWIRRLAREYIDRYSNM